MLRHVDYTRARLGLIEQQLRERIYPERRPVEELRVSPRTGRIRYEEAQKLEYRPVRIGEPFGPLWATFWFRGKSAIPTEWAERRVDLLWNSHSEATLWRDGRSIQGLNYEAGSVNSVRCDAVLAEHARGGETAAFEIEMACNRVCGAQNSWSNDYSQQIKSISPFVLDQCDLALFDPEAWELFHDFHILRQLESEQSPVQPIPRESGLQDGTRLADLDRSWGGELLAELNRFANTYVAEDRRTWRSAREILTRLYGRKNGSRVHEISAIGHAHIDLAWLWPVAESYRKCVRTFSSQTTYMDAYPEHRFACSQAQAYAWIKERNPDLWERIKAKVKSGQFIPVGGTWVEPDCNLTSGESLVRQFLVGQRFFQRELGVTCKEFWEPDVFGYNGQLPQIIRGAGLTRFLTQKLSWNKFNPPHHQTFLWQGIDGTEVLAHFPPTRGIDAYNARLSVEQIRQNAREYKDHDRSGTSMMPFGFGDGGGGPTKEMLEVLRRVGDLQGMPRVKIRTSDEFFSRLEAECTDLPTMVGELYFEYHRGTYTSQAAVKRGNRKGELLLHDVEFLAACAHRLERAAYPSGELDRLWKLLLLNHFHDILPGSSITEAYDDAARDHGEIQQSGASLRATALEELLGVGKGEPVPVNTIGCARSEVAEPEAGKLAFVEAPPYGVGRVVAAPSEVTVAQTAGGGFLLENVHLRAEVGADGTIARLLEKATGRQAFTGPGNVLEIYDDQPTAWDAWDVDPFHLETRKVCAPATGGKIITRSPLRGEVVFERATGAASRGTQTVRLDAGARRIEVHSEIDWRESHKMLKVAFPVAARAMNATYEMQFGCVERPTHYNTMYDLAKYEVPGHKWADLSEHGFGVALLSESKYGFSTYGSTMRLSLLRAPKYPDPDCDMGVHRFAYAVLPHAGGWREAGVVAEALRFNVPLCFARGKAAAPRSFARVDDPNLFIDTIKKAEDDEAIVLRLYEAHGARGVARLKVDLPFDKACFANLLEEDGAEAKRSGEGIEVPYRPFEIVTLKLR